MTSEKNGNGESRSPIGAQIHRDDPTIDLGKLANREAIPMPPILYLENARVGGEATILRNRLYELRDAVAEAGSDSVLSMQDYCLLRVLGELFARGSISTLDTGLSVPKRYLPKRITGEGKDAFSDRQAAASEAVKAAYRAAYEFIRDPGIDEEGAAAVQADVEQRRQILDREIRAAGGTPAGDIPESEQDKSSS
jgi:hypothetical protein